ncbi:hypothetical protein NN561_014809 [Cricetulus griseus]
MAGCPCFGFPRSPGRIGDAGTRIPSRPRALSRGSLAHKFRPSGAAGCGLPCFARLGAGSALDWTGPGRAGPGSGKDSGLPRRRNADAAGAWVLAVAAQDPRSTAAAAARSRVTPAATSLR